MRSAGRPPLGAVIMLSLFVATLGCTDSVPTDTGAIERQRPKVRDGALRPLAELDAAGLRQFLDQHRGKVILLDYWATWCQPCVEGYPRTVAISEKYSRGDLVVAAVAIESPDNRAAVIEFIDAQHAKFTNFIARNGDDLVSAMDEFEIMTGTLPTLKLYDRDGELQHTFGDGQPEPINFEEIEVAIRTLLRRDAPVN